MICAVVAVVVVAVAAAAVVVAVVRNFCFCWSFLQRNLSIKLK